MLLDGSDTFGVAFTFGYLQCGASVGSAQTNARARPEQSLGQMPTSHRTPRQPAKHSHATPLHRPLKPQGSAPTPVAYGLAQGASSAARPPAPPAATEQSSPDHVV